MRLSPHSLPRWTLLVAAAILAGCSRGSPAPPASQIDGLQEIGEVYKFLAYEKKPPPSKLNDLREYVDSLPNSWPKLEKGEYVLIWGVGHAATPPAGNTVLGHEKDVAAKGGAVLLRNGTVKQMTPQEFQAAPRARN